MVFRHKVSRELAVAPRSWFLTFSFNPATHLAADREIVERVRRDLADGRLYQGRLSARVDKAVCDWIEDEDLFEFAEPDFRPATSHQAVFARKVRQRLFDLRRMELMKEVSKFLKRLRERLGAKVRYTCVAEAHSFALAGRPHFHMLLHWADSAPPGALSARNIDACWRAELGFIHRRLVKDGESMAFYVAKYLAKEETSRVTGSRHYGGRHPEDSTLKVESPPSGVASANERDNDETTPDTTIPILSHGREANGGSRLRKFSLEETWAVGSAGIGTDRRSETCGSTVASPRLSREALAQLNERAFRELVDPSLAEVRSVEFELRVEKALRRQVRERKRLH